MRSRKGQTDANGSTPRTPRRTHSTSSSKDEKAAGVDTAATILGLPAAYFQFALIAFLSVVASVILLYTPLERHRARLYNKRSPAASVDTVGGWRLADERTETLMDSSVCNIDRKFAHQISSEHFEREYRYKKPVIVKFQDGAWGWTDPTRWTLQSLKEEYGAWTIASGTSEDIVRHGGRGDRDSSFTDFVDRLMNDEDVSGEPFYVFDRDFYNDSSLPKTLKPPEYFEIKDGVDDSIFFLGASRSGVSFHKHADAWNGVVYGRKRWFLYPVTKTPPGGVWPGYSALDWYTYVYPKLSSADKPLECVQEAGEIIYLPESIYHGTLNIGDTIAIGIQKRDATTEVEKLFYQATEYESSSPETSDEKRLAHGKGNVAVLESLLKQLPDSSEMHMKLGDAHMALGDFDTAIEYAHKATQIDPFFVIAFLNMGKMYAQKGDQKNAEKQFKHALKLNPKSWDSIATYGHFLMDNSRYSEAVVMFKKGATLKPRLINFWLHLRHAQELTGDVEGAKESSLKVKELEKLQEAENQNG